MSIGIEGELSGLDLLNKLEVPLNRVEILMLNGKAVSPAQAVIQPGDRVALLPPGTPGPYRVLLGFKNKA